MKAEQPTECTRKKKKKKASDPDVYLHFGVWGCVSRQTYVSLCVSLSGCGSWNCCSASLMDVLTSCLAWLAAQIPIGSQMSSGQASVLHSKTHLVCKFKVQTKPTFQGRETHYLFPLKGSEKELVVCYKWLRLNLIAINPEVPVHAKTLGYPGSNYLHFFSNIIRNPMVLLYI